ncbi:hypothetical protein MBLNU13_g05183t1 [Cladosporium sp. NU13]
MCRITDYEHTCTHRIQHVWSACRGQVKVDKDSKAPACQKQPSLYIKLATKCGSCTRTEAEQNIRRALSETNDPSTEDFESTLKERFADLAKQIPTANWRPLPSPVYSRKPSQKRVRAPRKNSLLRNEVKPEDACGPEAWEDNVVLPVYEAVEDGWNYPWTAETKTLAEELAEDEERRKADMNDGYEDGDGEDDVEDDVEEDSEGDEETLGGDYEAEGDKKNLGGDNEAEDKAEQESNDESPSEAPETIEVGPSESSVKVCYRFRKTTRGCKAQARQWELVEVWA